MRKEIEIVLLPGEAADENRQKEFCSRFFGIPLHEITAVRILRRSIDARSRQVKIRMLAEVYWNEAPPSLSAPVFQYSSISAAEPVIIVGSGPAGLFAALRLIELGLKPVVLERGKDVQSRRRDLAAINKEQTVNPDSNYCFGEGGAGTYSDGKLYTRSTKRGDIRRILNILVAHGAREDILIDAHPHIGTNKLPRLIAAIRQTILNAGGEVHFNTRVTDLLMNAGKIEGVVAGELEFRARAVILATGHSARDIFEMLHRKKIAIEAKPFALGVRIEHPQGLVDSIQYHCESRGEYLPAAAYSLTHQVDKRGVYSFCMCPGGFIVPSATVQEEVVVNGMSPSKRDSRFANSGIVVSVEMEDVSAFAEHGPLASLRFQQSVERAAWVAGGKSQVAPAQRMTDFVKGKLSGTLPDTSYQPGIKTALLDEVLPSSIAYRLKEGFKAFGQKMKGYYTDEAVLLGVESRTSSPVKIPRDPLSGQHPWVEGLFPCGEGAGYAGGIVSAAMDGEFSAEKSAQLVLRR